MFKPNEWKHRALEAEGQLAIMKAMYANIEGSLSKIRNMAENAAVLSSITREGRSIRFTFMRGGQVHRISTYGTYDDDVAGWQRDLLGDLSDAPTDKPQS